jgi:Pyruvate flavodoxin/ferredoxin oxidoreductase, thiamine diP-bdg
MAGQPRGSVTIRVEERKGCALCVESCSPKCLELAPELSSYHNLVLAPASVEEMADLKRLAFELSDRYRNPAIVLSDGFIGQMMEPLDLAESNSVCSTSRGRSKVRQQRAGTAWAASDSEREFGARERTRTSTTLRSLAPEASASASSATRARVKRAGLMGANRLRGIFNFARGLVLCQRGPNALENEECRPTNANLG